MYIYIYIYALALAEDGGSGQCSGEHLNHEREPRALVPAESCDGAALERLCRVCRPAAVLAAAHRGGLVSAWPLHDIAITNIA